jgi:hypothetical protein
VIDERSGTQIVGQVVGHGRFPSAED